MILQKITLFTLLSLFNTAHAMQRKVPRPAASPILYNQADYARALAGDKNLVGANLQGAVFEKTDFSNVDFTDANLNDARLIDVNLNHAKFIRTHLQRARIHTATGDARNAGRNIIFDGADASHAILGTCFTDTMRITDTKFVRAQFHRVTFDNSDFTNVDFSEATFDEGCVFQTSSLYNVKMNDCHFDDTRIRGCSLQNINLNKARINNSRLEISKESQPRNNTSTNPPIDGRTWKKIYCYGTIIINSWITGSVVHFCTPTATRNENLQAFDYPWYAPLLNPLYALKRALDHEVDYDEHNIDGIIIDGHFSGTTFLGVTFANIVFRDCPGTEHLERSSGCVFANVVIDNTSQNTRTRISKW